MKRLLHSLLLGSVLSVGVWATPLFVNDPFEEEFARMQNYINSMMQTHLSSQYMANFSYPRTDIEDTEKKIVLRFDLAGVAKENIKLTIDEHNLLTLKGEKKSKVEEKKENKNYVRREIFYGSFERVIQLPDNIVQEKLTTKYDDGILEVTIPKKERKKPKTKLIPIN